MGWFSAKKKTYVSSVIYNLAGDELKRPNYLKTTMVGAILSNQPSLGVSLTNAYLKGPGLRTRSYARWARTSGYTAALGQISGTINSGNSLNYTEIANHIIVPDDCEALLQSARIGKADYSYWVDAYMLDTFPDRIDQPYEADMDVLTNVITIKYPFPGPPDQLLIPEGYDSNANYLYVSYLVVRNGYDLPATVGPVVNLADGENFPTTSGWVNTSTVDTPQTATLTKTVNVQITYSDGRPAENSSTPTVTTEDYNDREATWVRTDYEGANSAGELRSTKRTRKQWTVGYVSDSSSTNTSTEVITGGVTKTTKTTTIVEVLSLARSHQTTTVTEVHSGIEDTRIFIYKENTGIPELDAMFGTPESIGQFLPYIPIRLDNKFLATDNYPELFDWSKRAYRRALGDRLTKTIVSIKDNENIGDIDFAYTVFGVSLNVRENTCKKYLFKFFEAILQDPNLNNLSDHMVWRVAWDRAGLSRLTWATWFEQQTGEQNPLYGTPEPPQYPYPDRPTNSIKIGSSSISAMNYDMTISWSYLFESSGTGLAKPGAKKDDLWLEKDDPETLTEYTPVRWDNSVELLAAELERNAVIHITWQEDTDTWRKISIAGLAHRNLVYNGKSVDITALEALDDEEESGFIIPLHEDIYRSMGVVDGTQMSTASNFLVFNCYKIVKQKWYQTGLFQIIVIIIVIIISFYDGGATASGVLGSSSAVGASLGFTGTTALIVGAAVNAIAGMILMTIIQSVAVGLFGDKLGNLIGAVIAVVALQVATSMQTGSQFSASFAGLMKADNIMKLTIAAGKGYAGYAQASVQEIAQETTDLLKQYSLDKKEVSDKYYELIGPGLVDSSALTEAVADYDFQVESLDSFMGRTLMTGSDIAELSLSMIGNFVALTTATQLP